MAADFSGPFGWTDPVELGCHDEPHLSAGEDSVPQ